MRIEKEVELHRVRHGPCRRFEREKAHVQQLGMFGRLGHIAQVTVDRSLHRLRPEEHFDTGFVAAEPVLA